MDFNAMGANEWLLIAAAIAGPILAVQAQKAVERAREKSMRRDRVFRVLMATRQARLSSNHVEALNSIDLAFYGRRILGRAVRGEKSQAVVDAWNTYRTHLSVAPKADTEAESLAWISKGEELFVNLLEALAAANKYRFDRTSLQTGSYSPIAHERREAEQRAILATLLEILSGQRALPLEIRRWPIDDAAVQSNRETQIGIAQALSDLAEVATQFKPNLPRGD